MKKHIKILSVLLAFIMLTSGMTTGVSAAYTAYNTPGGYDTLNHAYLTIDQCGSALLDVIDAALKDADIYEKIDLSILGSLTLDLRSVDRMMNSVVDLLDSGLYGVANTLFSLGDLEDLNEYWFKSSHTPRRTTEGATDLEVFYGICKFLKDNKTIVGKIVDGSVSLGFIGNFIDIKDYVGDVPAMVKEMVYGVLFDEELYGEMPAGMTVDQMINQKLNYLFVADPVDGKGILPSMSGKINVNTGTTYDFLRNTINAVLTDIVIPKLVDTLVDTFGIVIDDAHPDGYYDGTSSLDLVWKIIFKTNDPDEDEGEGEGEGESGFDSGALGELLNGIVEVPAELEGKAVPMLEYALNYIIMENPGFLGSFILRTEDGISLAPTFDAKMGELLTVLCNLMPMLNLNGITFKSETEIAALTTSEKFAYIGKMVGIGLIDFTVIPNEVETLRETVTYALISYCANILPDIDYLSRINYNVTVSTYDAINPATDGALMVAAGLIRYYINANIEMDIPEGLSFNATIEYMLNWALSKYGGVIYMGGMSSDTVWKKLDKILFGDSPLLCGIFQSSWLPTTVDRSNMTYDILFNKIIFALFDFNFTDTTGLFSLLKKNPTGELRYPVANVVLNLVARILNGVFENTEIIPIGTASFDVLFQKAQMRKLFEALLGALPTYIEAICVSVLPILVSVMGIVDMSDFDVTASPGAPTYTAAQLRTLLYSQIPKEQSVMYDEYGYVFFGIENFTPEFRYYDYMNARKDAENLLEKYDEYIANKNNPDWIGRPVTITQISKAAYLVNYYYNELIERPALNADRLAELRVTYDINNYNPSDYSTRSWNNFERAWAFAESVYEDVIFKLGNYPNLTQTMIGEARTQLIAAVKGLKPWASPADYTLLDNELIDAARYVAESNRYFADSASELLNIYQKALDLPRDYDLNDQLLIDNILLALQEAILNLVYFPAVISVETTKTVLDSTRKLAFGFDEGMYTIFSHVTNVGAGAIETVSNGKGFNTVGTNTTINLVLNGEVLDSYKVVIFGDVDGDGFADGNDAVIVSQYTNRVITEDDLGVEYTYAADADGDNSIDDLDVEELIDAGMFKTNINQIHEII